MQELPNNSYDSREGSETKADAGKAVVSGRVKKKRNVVERVADKFISDNVGNIRGYLLDDVIVPGITNTIRNIITSFANMIFKAPPTPTKLGGLSKISYRDSYGMNAMTRAANTPMTILEQSTFDDIILDSREDADILLATLQDIIARQRYVTVFDMYSQARIKCPYTYQSYGWTDISTARVLATREGFLLKMPKAIQIT